jgi:hypothetical protein
MAAIASLGFAAIACGTSVPLPSIGDASARGDATTKSDATIGSDAATKSDAAAGTPDAGALDASDMSDTGRSDAGPDRCADKICGQNQVCDPAFGDCTCAGTFVALPGGASCVPTVCSADADCDDGNACTGVERCDSSTHQCLGGTPVDCGAFGICISAANVASCQCAAGYAVGPNGLCASECPFPLAPDLSIIADDEVLNFVAPDGSPIELAVLPAGASSSTAAFQPASPLSLAALSGLTRVLAQTTVAGCVTPPFNAVYDVRATYAPAPPDATTTAVAYDDPRIVAWASGVDSYLQGPGVTEAQFMMPSQALGPAGTNTLAVVSLGNGGSMTLTFGAPITDGDSWDFAVFENSFASDIFLELGFVEVSSDGIHFARFDSAFQGPETSCSGCSGTAPEIGGLAGSYMVGYGTPFDLSALQNSPLVRDGTVDLTSVNYVRIVDIIGDGTTLDSFGRGIIDPLSNGPTAGFDLDGIAVLNQRP